MFKYSIITSLFLLTFLSTGCSNFFGARHSSNPMVQDTILKEAGNDAFGTIQEVMNFLYDDPNTDWKKVNLEALRLHLIQMQDMTYNVDVLEQTRLNNGVKVIIKPTTKRAENSMDAVLAAHPMQLKNEAGWDMQVSPNADTSITLTITTEDVSQVDEIVGLGYIGLMAYGTHHQPHHLSIATGVDPHDSHNRHNH